MGRTYLVDPTIQQYIDGVTDSTGWDVGLVIGQLSQQKDIVVHLITSRLILENDPNLQKPDSLDILNEQFIANHAKQVKRMLTGGFDVIGIYAVLKSDELKQNQGKLRQVLYSTHKALNKTDVIPASHSDRLLLQISSPSKTITCRTFDVQDIKSSGNPGEWKYQKVLDSFISLSTTFSLEIVIPVPVDNMSFTLQKQMLIGLLPVYQNIWNSSATINDQIIEDGDLPICPKSPEDRVRGKGKGKKSCKDDCQPSSYSENIIVNFLEEMKPIGATAKLEDLECDAKMLVRGTVSSHAYIHSKATVRESVEALKRDVLGSIVARCELLCDDLLQAEEEQDARILYETPLRVYARLPNTEIKFCDYLFQDETLSDSADRFRELFGMTIASDNIDSSIERLPEETDLTKPVRKVKLRKARTAKRSESSESKKPLSLLRYLGVATATVVAFISYWYTTTQDSI